MKGNIGKTVNKVRVTKGITKKELCHNIVSYQQLSNIEKGMQVPSVDKFIMFLEKMNVRYDEFILYLDNEYLKAKMESDLKLSEFVKRQNKKKLKELSEEVAYLFDKYDDVYFKHIELMVNAMYHLIENNYDFYSVKDYLVPIKDYLDNIAEWGHYELTLISQCLFMFDLETAFSLGKKALNTIEENYDFYRNRELARVLLNNMSNLALNDSQYEHVALKYSQMSISYATTNNDATRLLHAEIIYQIACFKSGNGSFDERHLTNLLKTFKILKWHTEYQSLEKFIQKHGISLSIFNK